MTGLFNKKLRVAVFDGDKNIASKIAQAIRGWFSSKEVVVESYSDSYEMLMELNIAKFKNKPFDMTIVGPDEDMATKAILEKSNPQMAVLSYIDDRTLHNDTAAIWSTKSSVAHL